MTLRKLTLYLVAPAILAFGLLLFGVQSADAATVYYVGSADSFTTGTNWHSSDASCGTSGDFGGTPDSDDEIIFGGSCDTSVTIPSSTNVQDVTLDTGYSGTVTAGASLDIDGHLTIESGATFDLNGESITISGDIVNNGTFTHNNGTVTFDGTGQAFEGSVALYNFTKSVSAVDTLYVTAGDTVTVTNALVLNGSNGNILSVQSSTSGTAATIDASAATKTVSFLSVKDITSANGNILCDTGCINRGNNAFWLFNDDGSTSSNDNSGLDSVVPLAEVTSPRSGDAFDGGADVTIEYTASEDDLDSIALYYSLDGGMTYELIASGLENTGSYMWEAPNTTTLKAVVKLALLNADGDEILSDDSPRFRLNMVDDISEEMEEEMDQDMNEEEDFESIHLIGADGGTEILMAGGLFRGETLSGVYMVNADGSRSVFPNEATFLSYGYSFNAVVTVRDDQLASLALGARVTMAEGSLVKIQSDNRVFEVSADGVLRHVPDEDTAIARYGEDWAGMVTDINVVFWGDYTIGSSL